MRAPADSTEARTPRSSTRCWPSVASPSWPSRAGRRSTPRNVRWASRSGVRASSSPGGMSCSTPPAATASLAEAGSEDKAPGWSERPQRLFLVKGESRRFRVARSTGRSRLPPRPWRTDATPTCLLRGPWQEFVSETVLPPPG